MKTSSSNTVVHTSMRQKVLSLAIPMGVTQLITVLSTFLSMIMLSRLGHEVLAASALIYSTQLPVMVTGASILFSLSILIGRAYGEKNMKGVGHLVQQGWILGGVLSIPLIIIFWNMDVLLLWFGQSKEIAQTVGKVFSIYVWAVPATLGVICNQQLCFSIHQQKLVAIQNVFSLLVQLTTAYVLIFGKWGAPSLGVVGFGYSMVASAWFSFVFMMLCFNFIKVFRIFELFVFRAHRDWRYLMQILKVGGHISLQVGGEMFSLMVLAAMVGWVGKNALAAYQVVTQYFFLVMIPIFVISQAAGVLVGQACGQNEPDKVSPIGRECIRLALIISGVTALVFWLFPKRLSSIYFDVNASVNAETFHLVYWMFIVAGFSFIFSTIKNVLTGALRGLLDSFFPMVVGLGVIWFLGIPLSYILAFVFNWGAVGILLGSTIAFLIDAIVIGIRWELLIKRYYTFTGR